jgi:hypothetical protein
MIFQNIAGEDEVAESIDIALVMVRYCSWL